MSNDIKAPGKYKMIHTRIQRAKYYELVNTKDIIEVNIIRQSL